MKVAEIVTAHRRETSIGFAMGLIVAVSYFLFVIIGAFADGGLTFTRRVFRQFSAGFGVWGGGSGHRGIALGLRRRHDRRRRWFLWYLRQRQLRQGAARRVAVADERQDGMVVRRRRELDLPALDRRVLERWRERAQPDTQAAR